jgi:ribonucleoside-diphosphate reductase alpha chain
VLRNACTEITSADDSDICNLGSLNMARFDTVEEFAAAVELATLFLLAGTVYSHLPHDEVYATREKNRRLGLGLMGIHEWLLKRGKQYGPDGELELWMEAYAESTRYATYWAEKLGLSVPVKTRAIAPNGTIGILAETTTSAEPIFAAAYKRRVRNADARGDTVEFEYVVDPTAARLVASGVNPELIEDAYSLSYDVERRVAMQAWLQKYVDHGISSTVNLPYVISDEGDQQEFGEMLMKYLPQLRGITCYPDGSRGGQPLTSVPLEYALDKTGVRFEENEERCVGGACGV